MFSIPIGFTDSNQIPTAALSPDYITEAQFNLMGTEFSSASNYETYKKYSWPVEKHVNKGRIIMTESCKCFYANSI